MKKLIYFFIFLLLFFGSNNYQEMNNLAIITNIAIEKEENNYHVTFQEIIPVKEENKIAKKYKYYTNTSNTLKSAFYNLSEDITKEVYLQHLENIIIQEDDVQIIYDLSSFLQSDLDNFNIILSKSNPKKVLEYSDNYKYVNSLIEDNITLRSIKKAELEHKNIKIPIVKIDNDRLIFYKYIKVGDKKYA